MKTGLRIICCGSRNFKDQELIRTVLATWKPSEIAHGDSVGADRHAGTAASGLGIEVSTYPALWSSEGRKAGPLRNYRMLQLFDPDIVFAFVNDPNVPTRGTADMIRQARKAGVPVMVFGGKT